MDEKHRTPGVESVTASEEVVTGSEEVVTAGSVTSDKPDTKVIRLNVTDIGRIMASGYEDEKPSAVVHRLLDEVDELRQVKSVHASNSRQIEVLYANIAELEEELDELRSGAGTASTEVVPGQQSFSIKDAMDSLKDVCDDDAVCIKFAAKMVETQTAAMNRHLDREHSAEQKRLDREDKDKDRALKKELAESKAGHDKDMTMIKKGMVKQSDLEDIVFLGQKKSPADRIANRKELAARQAASEEEEFGDMDPPGYGDPDHD